MALTCLLSCISTNLNQISFSTNDCNAAAFHPNCRHFLLVLAGLFSARFFESVELHLLLTKSALKRSFCSGINVIAQECTFSA